MQADRGSDEKIFGVGFVILGGVWDEKSVVERISEFFKFTAKGTVSGVEIGGGGALEGRAAGGDVRR